MSRKGLTFTPENESGKDAFTLTHDNFLPSSTDDTLTIKSNSKTSVSRSQLTRGLLAPPRRSRS